MNPSKSQKETNESTFQNDMTTTFAIENNPQANGEKFGGLDEREAAVIKEARYFEPYKNELHELFKALGREAQWSEDPTNQEFLSYMQRGWIGNEHGNSTEKDQFTPDQIGAAMPILERLGLTSELLPAPGTQVDQTIIVGGTTTANYRRTQLIDKATDQGIEVGDVICWYGQRPRESRDGTNEELVSTEGKYAGENITDNPWYKAYMKEALNSDDPWALIETDFGRIALNKVSGGSLKPYKIELPVVEVNGKDTGIAKGRPDVPNRDVLDYHFVTNKGIDVTLMNVAAVDRGEGRPSRHTTESCTVEWLERHAPAQNAKVMYVTGQPHSLRTAQDTYKILQKHGRGDIQLVVAGTDPVAGQPIQFYLGEVARLINNDVKRNYGGEKEVA